MKNPGKIKGQNRQLKQITNIPDPYCQQQTQIKLARKYPPHEVLHKMQYDRVNELKYKYNTSQRSFQSSNKQNNWNEYFYEENINSIQLQFKKIKNSYLENSEKSYRQYLNDSITSNDVNQVKKPNEIQSFKEKVQIVNDRLFNKIEQLERKLKQISKLKNKKVEQSKQKQNSSPLYNDNRPSSSTKTKQKQQSQRSYLSFNNKIQSNIKKLNIIQEEERQQSMKDMLLQNKQQQKIIESKLVTQFPNINISSGQTSQVVQLIGQFKGKNSFPKQYTIFINRIKEQINLDLQFTKLILNIEKKKLTQVKNCIKSNFKDVDQSYFQITPMQIDPLAQFSQLLYQNISLEEFTTFLCEIYRKIEDNFSKKLQNKFEASTIDILFEEIEQNKSQLTIGHLTSYINMRTGTQFRNRALVKLLRRMQICTQSINKQSFKRCFIKVQR